MKSFTAGKRRSGRIRSRKHSNLIYNISKRIAPLFQYSLKTTFRFISTLHTSASLEEFYNRLPTIDTEERTTIGEGTFGQIKNNTSNDFVLKQIPLSNLKNAMTEAFIHSVLSTDPIVKDHICTVYGIYQSPGYLVIKLERLPITLKDYIATKGPSKEILNFLKDLVNLIFYLRNRYKFQHCDLKYDNIMIKDGHVKLIDFGLGRMVLDGHIYMPDGEDTQDMDMDLLMLFAHLKAFDPLSDEAYEMILKGATQAELIAKIQSA
jgi:hypothetical protein